MLSSVRNFSQSNPYDESVVKKNELTKTQGVAAAVFLFLILSNSLIFSFFPNTRFAWSYLGISTGLGFSLVAGIGIRSYLRWKESRNSEVENNFTMLGFKNFERVPHKIEDSPPIVVQRDLQIQGYSKEVPTPILELPQDLFNLIFSSLDIPQLSRISRCCKKLAETLRGELFWQAFFQRHFYPSERNALYKFRDYDGNTAQYRTMCRLRYSYLNQIFSRYRLTFNEPIKSFIFFQNQLFLGKEGFIENGEGKFWKTKSIFSYYSISRTDSFLMIGDAVGIEVFDKALSKKFYLTFPKVEGIPLSIKNSEDVLCQSFIQDQIYETAHHLICVNTKYVLFFDKSDGSFKHHFNLQNQPVSKSFFGQFLYLYQEEADQTSVYQLDSVQTLSLKQVIPNHGNKLLHIASIEDQEFLIFGSKKSGNSSEIHIVNEGKWIHTIEIYSKDMKIKTQGKYLYLSFKGEGVMQIVDMMTGLVLKTFTPPRARLITDFLCYQDFLIVCSQSYLEIFDLEGNFLYTLFYFENSDISQMEVVDGKLLVLMYTMSQSYTYALEVYDFGKRV